MTLNQVFTYDKIYKLMDCKMRFKGVKHLRKCLRHNIRISSERNFVVYLCEHNKQINILFYPNVPRIK